MVTAGKGVVEAGYSHDRRDLTATPLCGAHRATGKNALLVKPLLGAVKATTYDLPKDFSHEYGLAQVRDGLTSDMVVGSWAQHNGTQDVMPARDFKSLNKAAVVSGCVDTKAMNDYRCCALAFVTALSAFKPPIARPSTDRDASSRRACLSLHAPPPNRPSRGRTCQFGRQPCRNRGREGEKERSLRPSMVTSRPAHSTSGKRTTSG